MTNTETAFNPCAPLLIQDLRPITTNGLPIAKPKDWCEGCEFRPLAMVRTCEHSFLILWEASGDSTETEGVEAYYQWGTMGGTMLGIPYGGCTFRRAWKSLFERTKTKDRGNYLEGAPQIYRPGLRVWTCPTFGSMRSENIDQQRTAMTGLAEEFAGWDPPSCDECGADQEYDPECFAGCNPYWLDSEYLLEGVDANWNFKRKDDDDATCLCVKCYNDRLTQGKAMIDACENVLGMPLHALEELKKISPPGNPTPVLAETFCNRASWWWITMGHQEFLVWGPECEETLLGKVLDTCFPDGHPSAITEWEDLASEAGMTLAELEEDMENRSAPEGFTYVDGGIYLPFDVGMCPAR